MADQIAESMRGENVDPHYLRGRIDTLSQQVWALNDRFAALERTLMSVTEYEAVLAAADAYREADHSKMSALAVAKLVVAAYKRAALIDGKVSG